MSGDVVNGDAMIDVVASTSVMSAAAPNAHNPSACS